MSDVYHYILKLFGLDDNQFKLESLYNINVNLEDEIKSILGNIPTSSFFKEVTLLSHNSKISYSSLFDYLQYYITTEDSIRIMLYLSVPFYSITLKSTNQEIRVIYNYAIDNFKSFNVKLLILKELNLFSIQNIKYISEDIMLNEKLGINKEFDLSYIFSFFILYLPNNETKAEIFFTYLMKDDLISGKSKYLYEVVKKILLISILSLDTMVDYQLRSQSYLNLFSKEEIDYEVSNAKLIKNKLYHSNKPYVIINSSINKRTHTYDNCNNNTNDKANKLLNFESTNDIFNKISKNINASILYKSFLFYLLCCPKKIQELVYNVMQNTIFLNQQSNSRLSRLYFLESMKNTQYKLFDPKYIRELMISFVFNQPYIDYYFTEMRKNIIYNERKVNSNLKDYDLVLNQYSSIKNDKNNYNIFTNTQEHENLKTFLSKPMLYDFLKRISEYNLGLMLSELEVLKLVRKGKSFKKKFYQQESFKVTDENRINQKIKEETKHYKNKGSVFSNKDESFEERNSYMTNILNKNKKVKLKTESLHLNKLKKSPKSINLNSPSRLSAIIKKQNDLLIEATNKVDEISEIEDMPYNPESDKLIDDNLTKQNQLILMNINNSDKNKRTHFTTENIKKRTNSENKANLLYLKSIKADGFLWNSNVSIGKLIHDKKEERSRTSEKVNSKFNKVVKKTSNKSLTNNTMNISIIAQKKEDSFIKNESVILNSNKMLSQFRTNKNNINLSNVNIDQFYLRVFRDIEYLDFQTADENKIKELSFTKYIPLILLKFGYNQQEMALVEENNNIIIASPLKDKNFLYILSLLKQEDILLILKSSITMNIINLCLNIYSNLSIYYNKINNTKNISILPYHFYNEIIFKHSKFNSNMNLALLNYIKVGNINQNNDSLSKLSSKSNDNLNYYTWTNKFISYLKSSQIVILPIFYNELDFVDGFKGNLNNNNFFSFIVFNVELKKIEIVENNLIFKENINSSFIKNIVNYFNVLFLNERINVNLTSWSCEYSEMDDHYSNICSDMSFFTLANLQRLQNLIQQKDEVKSINEFQDHIYLLVVDVLQNFINSRLDSAYELE